MPKRGIGLESLDSQNGMGSDKLMSGFARNLIVIMSIYQEMICGRFLSNVVCMARKHCNYRYDGRLSDLLKRYLQENYTDLSDPGTSRECIPVH